MIICISFKSLLSHQNESPLDSTRHFFFFERERDRERETERETEREHSDNHTFHLQISKSIYFCLKNIN